MVRPLKSSEVFSLMIGISRFSLLVTSPMPAADEKEIVPGEIVRRAERQLCNGAADAAPFQPLAETLDVAAVTVKIQKIRV